MIPPATAWVEAHDTAAIVAAAVRAATAAAGCLPPLSGGPGVGGTGGVGGMKLRKYQLLAAPAGEGRRGRVGSRRRRPLRDQTRKRADPVCRGAVHRFRRRGMPLPKVQGRPARPTLVTPIEVFPAIWPPLTISLSDGEALPPSILCNCSRPFSPT